MNRKMKRRLYRIITVGILLLVAVLLEDKVSGYVGLGMFLLTYAIIGYDILKKVVTNISAGLIFDENFLMSIATIGAFFVGDYAEAVLVMWLYQIGELFQSYAVNKSRRSIAELMNIRPDYANVRRNGELVQVDPGEVFPGEYIVVKPGERIPLDGIVRAGHTTLDTKELTGESMPRDLNTGDEVISGCININGVIEVEVQKSFGESTVSRILDLVENSGNNKAEAENFITRFARYYTPIVVVCAALLAVIPPIAQGFTDFDIWIYRALTFLVISCPCALVISVPLSFFGGIGGASRQGILIKGSNFLEALTDTEIMVMDKTGTLTKGNFKVSEIHSIGMAEQELLELAARAESYSDHPISQSLLEAAGLLAAEDLDRARTKDVEEIAGHGVRAVVDGRTVHAGNVRLLRGAGISAEPVDLPGTVVHVAVDYVYAGYILIADELKPDARAAIQSLRKAGVRKLVMLTGDNRKTGEKVGAELGMDQVYAELLPGDKVEQMQALLKERSPKGKLVFVGDGINDAPVLAGSDIGIAMGGLGSDAAIEAADIVIMTDEPSKIATAIRIARKTVRIVRQNIVFALGAKFIVLLLAAGGYASMGAAIFADVGVAILAIGNAIRTLRTDADAG